MARIGDWIQVDGAWHRIVGVASNGSVRVEKGGPALSPAGRKVFRAVAPPVTYGSPLALYLDALDHRAVVSGKGRRALRAVARTGLTFQKPFDMK